MLTALVRSAVHPFGSIIGEEIFQSGVIPSDTDFRIFRDHGRVPGLDIAFISHGHVATITTLHYITLHYITLPRCRHVYHTEHDTAHRVPSGSLQRAGDNVLAVLHR